MPMSSGQASPGRSGLDLQPEDTRGEIILNSPARSATYHSARQMGTLEQYTSDIQEAYNVVEEQEAWWLVSPDKDEQDNMPLRQQME